MMAGQELLAVARGDLRDDAAKAGVGLVESLSRHREESRGSELGVELELHVMEERAALQRIQLFDRERLLPRR